MPEPICSKQSPPRPQHPIFGVFRRGCLQFEHSVRRTHRQTGGITTIDPRHAGDTPTETFYGSNSPHQARGAGGQLGHHVGIRAPTAEARGVDRKAEARPTPPPPPSPPPKINQKSHAIPTQTFQALKYIVGIATVWGRFDSSGDRIACDIAREPQHCTRHRSRGRRRDRRARPGAGGQWQSLAGLRTTRPAIDQPPCATVVEGAGGPGGPDYGAHGRRRGQAPRKVARNSIARTFNKASKRCNSNDHNSNHEITARELRATLLGNRRTARAAGVKGAGGSGGPDCGARGRRRGLAGLRDDAQSNISDHAPLVWRAPEGPEGTGGLRDRPLRAIAKRVAISRAAGPEGARNTRGATSNHATQTRGSPRGPPRVHATSSHIRHNRECKHSAPSRGRALSAVAQPRPQRPGPRSGQRPCAGCRRRRPG